MGLGGLVGTALGGVAGQRLFNLRRPLLPLFMGAAAVLGTGPFWVLLNLPTPPRKHGDDPSSASSSSSYSSYSSHAGGSGEPSGGDPGQSPSSSSPFSKPSLELVAVYITVALVTGVLITMTGNNVRAMLQNTTRPRGRGTAFAIFALSDDRTYRSSSSYQREPQPGPS